MMRAKNSSLSSFKGSNNMPSPPGSFRDPTTRSCWETCQACYRCEAKGTRAACNNCSGRLDPFGVTDPHPDDRCRCREGILQYVKANGQLTQVRYKTNPYKGKVLQIEKTEDERDWEAYLNNLREKHDNPNLDPIEVTDYGY